MNNKVAGPQSLLVSVQILLVAMHIMPRFLELSTLFSTISVFGSVHNTEVVKDANKVISVVSIGDKFEVLPGRNLLESVVVWATFTDDQNDNGWMFLEISTNQAFPDEVQAKAAGFAEGYLTRNSIHEYYKEFFAKDICKGEEGAKVCEYMK